MTNKIIYWTATGLISLMMLFSAYAYFADPNVSAGFTAMGFKDFFRIELGIAKILGVIVLLIPAFPKLVKEWAYAGFGITFISAFIAHAANGDPVSAMIMPLVALALLVVSRVFLAKIS
ncbi:DoxX-like family protein [Algoriphagus locisalis]|uniref:DoxX-like family protein n=1 Tax=Algoriphagus locisalis TaxID=305507 RepID=A0A1I6YPP3_9BACT|nr:DoxX family protein [Algoriphagus locisalis]SFT52414.1 DoxX-like family protein [Algoriphagus locisalis]